MGAPWRSFEAEVCSFEAEVFSFEAEVLSFEAEVFSSETKLPSGAKGSSVPALRAGLEARRARIMSVS